VAIIILSDIDIAIEKVQGLISFFKNYRETGFSNALESAKEIACEMDIEPVFRTKRKIKRKWQFDETRDGESIASRSPESIKIDYFLPVVDQAIASLTKILISSSSLKILLVFCLLHKIMLLR
jgi:hypothetical protein